MLSINHIKPYQVLSVATQWLIYSYLGLLIVYFLLRLIFWDSFWIVGFISIFIPLIFLPLLILPIIVFFLIKKRWLFIISGIACILLIGWLHWQYFSPIPIPLNPSQPSIKILSLNCGWYKTSSENLSNLIQKEQPNIVFLQEIVLKHTKRAFVWLKETYPYQAGEPPVAILSKYPILSTENLNLAGHQEVQQRAIIKVNQQDIVVYNMSASSPWIRLEKILPFLSIPSYDYSERTAEIQDLLQRIKKETLPVIVVGDFNMTDQSQDYNKLTEILQDAFQKSGFGFGFTWPHGWELSFLIENSQQKLNYPIFRIDYIWYSQHFGSHYAKVLPATGSEHLPIEAEISGKKTT
ncbi:MAG: endonuclease/exonuclease/phosphatase family protein [Phormidium sp.]